MKFSQIIKYIITGIAILNASILSAATWYSCNTTDPSNLANWWSATNCSGTHPANFTTAGDVFIVQTGHTVTTAAVWTVGAGVTVQLNGILSISTGATHTLPIVVMNGGTITFAANRILNIGTLTVSASSAIAGARGTINITGATTVNSTLNITSTGGTKTFTGLVTINTGGVWNHTGTCTLNFAGGITNSGSFTASTGLYTFLTNSQALTGSFSIPSITVTGVTLTNNNTLYSTTALNGTGTLLQAANSNLYIGFLGPAAITTINASANGNTVYYNLAGNQTIKGGTFHHLVIAGSGIKTLNAATAVNGNLTINAGTFADGAFAVTGVAGGVLSVAAGASYTTTRTAAPFLPSNMTVSLNATSTVNYNANATFTLPATPATYGHIGFAGGGTKTASSILSIAGNCTVTAGTFSTGGFNVGITGNLTGAGGLTNALNSTLTLSGATNSITTLTATANPNTVIYNSTISAQTVKGTTYNNLTIDKSTQTATIGGVTTINGTLTITSGTLQLSTQNLTCTGNTIVNGTIAENSVTGAKSFANVTINSGGTWNSTVAEAFTITGNLIVNAGATFTPNTGIYTFSGAAKSISGTITSITIPNLTITGTVTNNMTGGGLIVSTALAGAGTLTQGANSLLYIGGTSAITGLTATANPNTVYYNRTTAGQTIKGTTYHHLIIDKTAQIATLGANTTVNGDLTITSGTLQPATLNLTVTGNTNLTGTITDNSNTGTNSFGTVNFTGGTITSTTAAPGSTYGITTLNATTGNGTIGAATVNITGTTTISATRTLTISSATGTKTFADVVVNGIWNNTGNSPITVSGSLTSNTGSTFTAGTGVYTFSGAAKTIGGSSTSITIPNLTISGTLTNNILTGGLTVSTSLAGAGTLTQGTNSILNIGGTAAITTLTATANPNTVIYNGAAPQTTKTTTYHHLTISSGNTATLGGNTSVNGNLSVNSGTFQLSTFNISVTGSSTITGTIDDNSATGTNTFGDIVINDIWNSTGNSNYIINGSITVNTGSTINSGNGVYTLQGSAKTIGGTSSAFSFNNVSITGTYTNNSTGFTVSTALSGAGSLTNGSGAIIYIGGTNTITTFACSTNPNTVFYNSTTSAQTVRNSTYHHLTIDKSGQIATLGGAITINGNLLISNGTLSDGGFQINGNASGTMSMAALTNLNIGNGVTATLFPTNFTNANISLNATSTVNYQSTSAQSVSNVPAYGNITISNGNTKTLGGSVNINGTLTLNSGILALGSNTITLGTNGSISGTYSSTNMITVTSGTGTITKQFTSVPYSFSVFPIGTGTSYTPASINITSATIAGTGSISIKTTTAKQPNEYVSTNALNKYWTVTSSNISNISASIQFTYAQTEADATYEPGNQYIGGYYPGSLPWDYSGVVDNATNVISFTRAGSATLSGDYTAGPDIAFNNNPTYYSRANGSWETPGSWSTISHSGTASASAPGSGSQVDIGGGFTITKTTSTPITITNLQLDADGTLDLGTQNGLTITTFNGDGLLKIASSNFPTVTTNNFIITPNSTVEFNSTNSFTLPAGVSTYPSLIISGGSSSIKTISGNTIVSGNLTISASTSLADGGNTVTVKGNLTNNGTHSGAGKLYLSGGSAQHTVSGGGTYGNFEINDTYGAILASNISSITGDLTITSGELVTSTNSIIGAVGKTFTILSGASYTTTRTAAPWLPSNMTAVLNSGSTVNFNGDASFTLSSIPTSFGHLSFGGATSARTKTLPAATPISINGNLTINTLNTLADNGNTISITGNITNNGTHSGSGKLMLTGGSVTHSINGSTCTFQNIEVNDNLGVTWSGSGTTTVNGTLTVTAGTLTFASFTTALNVAGATSNSGTITFSSTTGTKSFGDITLTGTGVWNPSVAEDFTISGSIINNGTFTPNSGIYTLSGAAKTFSGTSTTSFQNVIISGTYTNNGTISVSTDLGGAGSFTNGANSSLYLGGTNTITTFTATAVPNTVIFNNTSSAQSIRTGAYHHITLANTGQTATPAGNLTINGDLSISSGNLQLTTNNISVLGTTTVNGAIDDNSTTGVNTFNNISVNGTWTNSGGDAFDIAGNFDVNTGATFTPGSGAYTFSGTNKLFGGTLNPMTIPNISIQGGSYTNNGYLSVSTALGGNGSLVNGTNAVLYLGGTCTINTLNLTAVPNTVVYNSTTAGQTVLQATYYHLTIDKAGQTADLGTNKTISVTGDLNVTNGTIELGNNDLSVTGNIIINGTLSDGSATGANTFGNVTLNGIWNANTANPAFTINGDFNVNLGSTFNQGTGLYTFAGTNKTFGGTASPLLLSNARVNGSYSNSGTMEITALQGTGTLTNNNSLTLTGTVNVTGAGSIVNGATGTLYIPSTTLTSFPLNASAVGNTVIYNNSTAQQTVKGTTYHHLTVDCAGQNPLIGAATTINGDFLIDEGTLSDNGFQISGNASGDFTINSGASLVLGNATTATSFPTNFSTPNILINDASTVTFNSNQAQTISSVPEYTNLVLASTVASTKTASGNITVKRDLTINTLSTFADGGNTVTVRGNITNNGSHSGTGSITIANGYADHTITCGSTSSFANLTVNDNAFASTINGSGFTTITGNMNISTGTLSIDAFTNSLKVTGTTSISGTLDFTNTTGSKDLGSLSLNSGGILNNTIGEDVTISGNVVMNGTFNPSSEIYTLSGIAKTITGSSNLNSPNITVTGTYTYDQSVNSNVNNLVVNSAAQLTITKDRGLTASTSTLNSGTLLVDAGPSGHSGSLITTTGVNNTGGTYSYKTSISKNSWHCVSSPVGAANIQDVFTQLDLNNNNFFYYDESVSTNYWVRQTSGALVLGKGYYTYFFGNKYKTYSGTFNHGDVDINITYTSNGRKGWNLLSNPYPSALDWDHASWDKSNITGAYYVRNGSTWESYNNGVGDAGQYIYPGQGFFVVATQNATFTIPNAARAHNNSGYLKSNKTITDPLIKLSVTNGTTKSSTYIRFNYLSSHTFDIDWDAHKFFATDTVVPEIYTVCNNDDTLSINTMPLFDENTIIPVGIKIKQAGTYTIRTEAFKNFSDNNYVYLYDSLLGVYSNVKQDSVYSFTTDSVNNTARFYLKFKSEAISTYVEKPDFENKFSITQPYFNGDEIWIIVHYCNCNDIKVEIYDLTGKTIYSNNYPVFEDSQLISIKSSAFRSGVYLMKISNRKETITKKLITISK